MTKIAALFLLITTLALAEPADRTGPYIAIGGGYAVFDDDDRMEAEQIDPSFNVSITGGAFINKYLSVELCLDYYETFTNETNTNSTGIYFFDAAVKAHYPFWKERIDLYAAFGAGGIAWKENLNGVSQNDNSSATRGDVGIGFRAQEWLTFNVGFRRYFFTLDHDTGTIDPDNNIIYERYNMQVSSGYANIEVQF